MAARRHIVVNGRLTTPGLATLRALGFAGPALLVLFLLMGLPLLGIVVLSFAQRDDHGGIVWAFTFDNYVRAAGWSDGGYSGANLRILGISTGLAALTTVLCVVLAYPMAFVIALCRPPWRGLLLGLVTIPCCINLVVRTYAWQLILHKDLPVARGVHAAQAALLPADAPWFQPGQSLYPTMEAVTVGLIAAMLPFAVLPLYASVERMDWRLVAAARDLYAGPWRTFRHAILPQTMPGLVAAFILTFIPALGMYVVSNILGGSKYLLIGNLIGRQFNEARDWPYGAALGTLLILVSLAGLVILSRFTGRREADPDRTAAAIVPTPRPGAAP